ncbi:MAG: hypothetical protein GX572_05900 [Clostridia bacterium]|nr:hypothetical protein [Clostridia bacterium]
MKISKRAVRGEAKLMHKSVIFALMMAFMLAVTGCAAKEENGNIATSDSFVLRVVNEAADEIYGLHMAYYLQGEQRGGCGVINADGSPFAAGESISQDFWRSDFPADADLSSLEIKVSVILADDARAAIAQPLTPRQFGYTYDYLLSGDSRQGYALTKTRPQ